MRRAATKTQFALARAAIAAPLRTTREEMTGLVGIPIERDEGGDAGGVDAFHPAEI